MGYLAAFLISVFGGLVSYLTKKIGAKLALAASFMVSYVAILTVLWIALKALILALVLVVNNQWLTMGFWLLWPANAEAVISACLGADLAVFIYRIHVENVKALAYIT
jgi:hypothetical protein